MHESFIVVGMLTVVFGCTPEHGEGSLEAAMGRFGFGQGVCGEALREEFQNGYHAFLSTNCNSCHILGGEGKGAFADNDVRLAFDVFAAVGFAKVSEFAVNPSHKSPYTGEQHAGVIEELKTSWTAAETQYNECLLESQTNNGDDGTVNPIQNTGPRQITIEKPIAATDTYAVKSFDLGTEMDAGQPTYAGARLEVEVRTFTSATGETSYNFRNPKLTAGAQALEISDLRIALNGQVYEAGTTWQTLKRKVPANDNRTLSSGVIIREGAIQPTDKMGFSLGSIATTTFNPAKFSQLVGTGGIFAQNCVGCHSGGTLSGGLNITNYQDMINHFVVIPFDPEGSILLSRMNNPGNPMPQSGLLPEAQRKSVEDWILDGAPNN